MLKQLLDFVMDMLETMVFIGSFFIVVYLFILQPNQIKGKSMFPTFDDKEYILTSKISYKFRKEERGDIIVVYKPESDGTINKDIEYIKRIIGLPGDEILITEDGTVRVNGQIYEEKYIAAKTTLWLTGALQPGVPYSVQADELFIMGDNRPNSSDSRQFGSIKRDSVIGVVVYRYLPVTRQGPIQNPILPSLRT
jgi:signal peptidase I